MPGAHPSTRAPGAASAEPTRLPTPDSRHQWQHDGSERAEVLRGTDWEQPAEPRGAPHLPKAAVSSGLTCYGHICRHPPFAGSAAPTHPAPPMPWAEPRQLRPTRHPTWPSVVIPFPWPRAAPHSTQRSCLPPPSSSSGLEGEKRLPCWFLPTPCRFPGGGHKAPEPPHQLSRGLAWQPATQNLLDASSARG